MEEGVAGGKRKWEGGGTDRVSSNGAEPPKQNSSDEAQAK